MMLDGTQIAAYLDRIQVERPERPDAASLVSLQRAHLHKVPFENLDIHRGIPITLDVGTISEKIISGKRGGYCYELNSLFAALLDGLGYAVDMVSARVARDDGVLKQEFGHMALVVRTADIAIPYLVDVGFGDGFTRPLPLVPGNEVPDRDRVVRLSADGERWLYEEDGGQGWRLRYVFGTEPRRIGEFEEMNHWQQTSPESRFTAEAICSLFTDKGRVTVAGSRLILTEYGKRIERELTPDQVEKALREQFGIVLAD